MRETRKNDALRPVKLTVGTVKNAFASVTVEWGNTAVLCCASVEDRVPPHIYGTGGGWITAEYSMLPAATSVRNQRDVSKLKLSPRSAEIQRLIGRALRAGADMKLLGERTVTIDCDVLNADGGTRCASVTGGWVALYLACSRLVSDGIIAENPVKCKIAAVSAGIVGGIPLLDLEYSEDSAADVDMNVVMTSAGGYVELQGTGEKACFGDTELKTILSYSKKGLKRLFALQERAVAGK